MNKLLLLVFLLSVVVVALVQADESRSAEDRRRIADDRRRLRSDESRLKKDEKSSRSRSDESNSRRRSRSDESRRHSGSDESRRRDRSDKSHKRSGSDESHRRSGSDESRRRDRSDDTRSRSSEDRRRIQDDRRRLRADERRLRQDERRNHARSDESRKHSGSNEKENRKCGSDEKRDCKWNPWKVAIRCSVSCGRGQRLLVRRINQTQCNGGKPCEGRGFKVKPCNTKKVCLSKRLDEFCKDRGDGEFGLGHCTDIYARCRKGHGKVHDCRHGQRFSHREGHCANITNVDECKEERNQCKDKEDGKYKLGDCREEYLFCNDHKGHVRRCRRHHVFDSRFKGCAPKSLVSGCRKRDRGCRDKSGAVVEGKLAVNGQACHEWYKVCKDGHAVLAKCPEDKPKFNPYARQCQTRRRCSRALRRHRSGSDESSHSGSREANRHRSSSSESRRRSRSNESRRRSRSRSNESRRRSRSNESRRRSRSNESRRRSRSNESRH